MNKFFEYVGRFLLFAALTTVGAITLNAASAHATGTIEGGTYCVNMRVDDEVICSQLNDDTTVELSPAATGINVNVDSGKIKVEDVPAGVYTVTVNYELSETSCSTGFNIVDSVTLIPSFVTDLLRSRICSGDGVYQSSRVFTNVRVVDGQTTYLEGNSSNQGDQRIFGNAIRVDPETGLPILECSGGSGVSSIFTDWVICPVIESFIRLIDLTINNILVPFLSINPLTITDEDGNQTQAYLIWDNLRNLANLLFILVFFVMIFWQSIGSVYGVKKILPRLIMMAIAANLSFFLCQFLIDLSNILGVGIATLLTTLVVGQQPILDLSGSISAIYLISPPVLIAMFIFVMFIAIMLLIGAATLLLRQVLLLFLVIVSPIAFAAGVLPNTSNFLSRWFTLFIRLILMYPFIMLFLSASRIASYIITNMGT